QSFRPSVSFLTADGLSSSSQPLGLSLSFSASILNSDEAEQQQNLGSFKHGGEAGEAFEGSVVSSDRAVALSVIAANEDRCGEDLLMGIDVLPGAAVFGFFADLRVVVAIFAALGKGDEWIRRGIDRWSQTDSGSSLRVQILLREHGLAQRLEEGGGERRPGDLREEGGDGGDALRAAGGVEVPEAAGDIGGSWAGKSLRQDSPLFSTSGTGSVSALKPLATGGRPVKPPAGGGKR
ncbi:unnamed protein product, partial [Linum tenue]